MPAGFYHPKTRTYVRLLGPCFKANRMKSYDCQQPWHSLCTFLLNSLAQIECTAWSPPWLKTIWERRAQPKRACVGTPLLDLSLHSTSYNTSRKQLPSYRAYDSVPAAVDTHRDSSAIRRQVLTVHSDPHNACS